MNIRISLFLFLFFLNGNLICQNHEHSLKTGILGLDLNLGRNSIYGAGGLSFLVRPINNLEFTGSFIVGGAYEGPGYYVGLGGFISPYQFNFKPKFYNGQVCFNPFLTFGFSSLIQASFANEFGALETAYYYPGNKYLAASTGFKIEFPNFEGSYLEDHFFLNIGITYRYSITMNKVQYKSGYFNQINLDNINRKVSNPVGFSFGGGFYIHRFLSKRELPF